MTINERIHRYLWTRVEMYYSYNYSEQRLRDELYKRADYTRRNVQRDKNKILPKIEKQFDKTNKKQFIINFITFVLRTSSIHGLRHLSRRNLHPVEYLLWLTGIITGMVGIYWLSSSTWNHYQNSPTVISIQNNYQEWTTLFPAITICPINKITTSTETFYQKVIEKSIVKVENEEALYDFMNRLANWTYTNPQHLTNYHNVKPSDYIWIYSAAKHTFGHTMSYNDIESLKNEELNVYVTEFGLCYSYLSRISTFNDPQYWKEKKWEYTEGSPRFGSNPLDGDNYFQFTFSDSKGFVAFIHSPEENPDASSKQDVINTKNMRTLGLTALSIYSTPETNYLTVQQRKCRFLWESDLPISPIYTYNTCRMNCRRNQVIKLCGCVPYFYRPVGQQRVCDGTGLECVSHFKDLLIKLRDENDKKVDCKCLPTCNDVNYIVEEERMIAWAFGAELRWGIIRYPRIRYKREIIFGITDVLVSVGGTAGLFLGCSALSFIEILFFFTLHLIWFIAKKEHQELKELKNNGLQQNKKLIPVRQKENQLSELFYY